MALRDYLAGEVAADYADGFVSRREAIRRLGLLGLGLTSASTLLAACGGDDDDGAANGSDETPQTSSEGSPPRDPATQPSTTPTTSGPPVAAEEATFDSPFGELQAAEARPATPKGALLLIHENRGLTPHFYDLTGRFATAGYTTVCVDLLSTAGGTASLTDPAAAPAALADMPDEQLIAMLTHGIDHLLEIAPGAKVGVVGFCFGGAMTWNLVQAGDRRIAAAVPFYGPAPEAPDFSRSIAAVLAIYAGEDARVNASRASATAALEQAGLTFEIKTYEGVDHAFFNDTGPRYDEAAATDAYALVLDWLERYVAA